MARGKKKVGERKYPFLTVVFPPGDETPVKRFKEISKELGYRQYSHLAVDIINSFISEYDSFSEEFESKPGFKPRWVIKFS